MRSFRLAAFATSSSCLHNGMAFRAGAGLRDQCSNTCPVTRPKHYSSAISRVKASSFTHHGCSSNTNLQNASSEGKIAYVALGSNIGDRIGMIETACDLMDARGIKVVRTSSLWETEPMYVLDQNSFINGVCEVRTTLQPLELLDQLQDIEQSMGREKLMDKGPRNIDLDILLYEDMAVNHVRLNIPHVGIPEREFVLRPLAELIPQKPLYADRPWKLTQDYLNMLPRAVTPMSTTTPLAIRAPPLHAMKAGRTTQMMAILNATPDSFSDGGLHTSSSLASTVSRFVTDGASIIDVGGQSTAPHAPEVSTDEEIARVVPAIEAIRRHPLAGNIIISIDTYRSAVAIAAVSAGADLINDVSGGTMDSSMFAAVAKLGKTICIMHMRGTPATMNKLTDYGSEGVIATVAKELLERVAAAESAGIRRWRIILDPGIGFAKTAAQNLEILRRFEELKQWPGLEGLPWLLGSSRKSFIGRITGVSTPAERVWGTATTVVAAVQGGADIVRVHDVKEMAQVVKMADAIWRV